MSAEPLDDGRRAFADGMWRVAHDLLTTADRSAALDADDLERLAVAAHLLGLQDDCSDAWQRAHRRWLARGEVERAVRCAFWVYFELLNCGEVARGRGWLARAQRLLDQHGLAGVERGYLALCTAFPLVVGGDAAGGLAMFGRAAEIGERFGDPDLTALARNGQGRSLIRLGQPATGIALLDEVMVAVTGGEVSPIVTGTVYCSVVEACREIFDLRRAQEWTALLSDWCDAQPDLVPYRGECLVHRCEILQRSGAWAEALDAVRLACDRLSRPRPQAALGTAYYRRGELCRVRGDLTDAASHYQRAGRWGHDPQPGLALLRLAQGQGDAALASLDRALAEAGDAWRRPALLAALVDVTLDAGDVGRAVVAARELEAVAVRLDAAALHAESAYAHGAVRLAEGDARAALDALRRAWRTWQELDAPYEAARARVLVGLSCRALGDADAAALELDAAADTFRRLGARPDLRRVTALGAGKGAGRGPLTAREVEVLRLVATGKTNRAIAEALVISQKTVATHLGNIFTKLGLSSRAAATAYAYEHELV